LTARGNPPLPEQILRLFQ